MMTEKVFLFLNHMETIHHFGCKRLFLTFIIPLNFYCIITASTIPLNFYSVIMVWCWASLYEVKIYHFTFQSSSKILIHETLFNWLWTGNLRWHWCFMPSLTLTLLWPLWLCWYTPRYPCLEILIWASMSAQCNPVHNSKQFLVTQDPWRSCRSSHMFVDS